MKTCKKCGNTRIFHERKDCWICGMCGNPIIEQIKEDIKFEDVEKWM